MAKTLCITRKDFNARILKIIVQYACIGDKSVIQQYLNKTTENLHW